MQIWPPSKWGRIKGDPDFYKTHPGHSVVYSPSEYYQICETAMQQDFEKQFSGNGKEDQMSTFEEEL
jgi:hypothetical protein